MPDVTGEPWWVQLAVTVVLLIVTAFLSWVGWIIKGLAKAFIAHLGNVLIEMRALRTAINGQALRQEAALGHALDESMEGHEKTQNLVRSESDRIVRKIEDTK